jgi:hypothetical protein
MTSMGDQVATDLGGGGGGGVRLAHVHPDDLVEVNKGGRRGEATDAR